MRRRGDAQSESGARAEANAVRAHSTTALTVSVVIPVKDDGELLRRCLRALALQTRVADEIIVVDNASNDASAEIARLAGARVVHCANPGIAAASAAGYDVATGDCILRLDADCIPSPHWVRVMEDTFASRPGVSVLTGSARFVDGPRALRRPLAAVYLGAYVAATVPALGHMPLFGSNLGFRRSAWLAVRDRIHRAPNIHDDLDLAYHFGERHRIRMIRGTLMGISMRPLASLGGFARRVDWGMRTVLSHWPQDFPTVRWVRLASRRILHLLGVPAPGNRRR